jgi:hypothetical protein
MSWMEGLQDACDNYVSENLERIKEDYGLYEVDELDAEILMSILDMDVVDELCRLYKEYRLKARAEDSKLEYELEVWREKKNE